MEQSENWTKSSVISLVYDKVLPQIEQIIGRGSLSENVAVASFNRRAAVCSCIFGDKRLAIKTMGPAALESHSEIPQFRALQRVWRSDPAQEILRAPRPIALIIPLRTYVMDWVQGQSFQRIVRLSDPSRDRGLKMTRRACRLLANYHAVGEGEQEVFRSADVLEPFHWRLEQRQNDIGDVTITRGMAALAQLARRLDGSPYPAVQLHGDPVAKNFLFRQGSPVMIDFSADRPGDPLRDVAALLVDLSLFSAPSDLSRKWGVPRALANAVLTECGVPKRRDVMRRFRVFLGAQALKRYIGIAGRKQDGPFGPTGPATDKLRDIIEHTLTPRRRSFALGSFTA